MFMTTDAAAVWQSLLDDELKELTRGEFHRITGLHGEDLDEAWADFCEARDRVFGA